VTTRTLIFCETCSRSEDAEGAHQRGWGTVSTAKQGTRDACPGCLAKFNGWRPPVANAGLVPLGRRLVEIYHDGGAL
jgi:hypothetical protein